MRAWLASIAEGRLLEVGLVLGLGYAVVNAARDLVDIPIGVLSEHLGRYPFGDGQDIPDLLPPSPTFLNFNLGETVIFYGDVLASILTLGLVALVGISVVRYRDRRLGLCPFCTTRIPYRSTHCAFCGSGVAPGEP